MGDVNLEIKLNNLDERVIKIEDSGGGGGTVDAYTKEETDALLSGKVDNEVVSDAWNDSTTYQVGQYCIYNNSLWKCLVQHNGQIPLEGIYWTKVSVTGEIVSIINQFVNVQFVNLESVEQSNFTVGQVTTFRIGKLLIISVEGNWSCIEKPNNYVSCFKLPFAVRTVFDSTIDRDVTTCLEIRLTNQNIQFYSVKTFNNVRFTATFIGIIS